ncbi:hypothetical protein [Sphingobium yanoikuyae]|uniref:hypothetical protein n=1 Tax=Sphingobium yanoikuyae TaxID=13690 RepID=UPI0035B0041E
MAAFQRRVRKMVLPNATKNIFNTIATVAIAQDVAVQCPQSEMALDKSNGKNGLFQAILSMPERNRLWMGGTIFGFNVRPLFLGRWALHRSVMGRA